MTGTAVSGTTVTFNGYRCDYGTSWVCGLASGEVTDVGSWSHWVQTTTFGDISMAMDQNGCVAFSYTSSGGAGVRQVFIDDSTPRTCSTCSFNLTLRYGTVPITNGDFVVGSSPQGLLGVGMVAGGTQLFRSTDCATWQPIGAPEPSIWNSLVQPAMIGTRPAFFYRDGTGLRVHIP